jgi:hypothetical protein
MAREGGLVLPSPDFGRSASPTNSDLPKRFDNCAFVYILPVVVC